MKEPSDHPTHRTEQIKALAQEAGVSEDDIRAIIDMVGLDRASILREARYLKKTRGD